VVREAATRKLGMRHFDVQVFDYTLYYPYTCTHDAWMFESMH
jgi:hypothetical protein